jgi:NAD(P)-dependent dehydrogenase (short-subunit alcohol dehydrogenase family)
MLSGRAPVSEARYDRVAVVTGGDSGIGKATAVMLAEEGFDVGITFHCDDVGAQQTVHEILAHGRRAAVRRHDLTDPVTASEAVDDLARAPAAAAPCWRRTSPSGARCWPSIWTARSCARSARRGAWWSAARAGGSST